MTVNSGLACVLIILGIVVTIKLNRIVKSLMDFAALRIVIIMLTVLVTIVFKLMIDV